MLGVLWNRLPGMGSLAVVVCSSILVTQAQAQSRLGSEATQPVLEAAPLQVLPVALEPADDAFQPSLPILENYGPSVDDAREADAALVAAKLGNGNPNAKSILVWLDPAADRPADPGAVSIARQNVRQFAAQRGAAVRYEYEILPNVINLRGVTQRDIDALKQMPGVSRVEEDQVFHISAHDSMPLIRGLESQKSAAGISARGTGVRVCIIDTGINAAHSMFAGRIDAAADWDHFNNDADPADDQGHGSNVAGIAAGSDGFTVNFGTCGPEPFQGVAPGATIIAMKVCSSGGSCPTSDIVAGINDCASTALPGGQADVINLSLGGGQFSGFCDTEASASAANAAVAAGVTVVAAAGNNGFANALGSPACGSSVIPVGAVYDASFPNCQDADTAFSWCLNSFCTSTCTDSAPVDVNERVCFSNRSGNLELSAPGALIWSAGHTGTTSIIEMAGTSQASPHVAGLAALILGEDPSLTPAQVLQLMRDGAVDLGAAGFDSNFGWGRIDVINTLNLISTGCTGNPECDDGLFCNGAETCNVGTGECQAGSPPNCADSVACTTDSCNESTDSCNHTPNNGACNDSQFCNGSETCHVTLGCQAGTPPNCADSVACTVDSCNEGTDSCDHTPNNGACSDGLFCNGAETCHVTLGCQAGSDPCPGQSCDEGADVCVGCVGNPECDDGLFCNGAETCVAGSCQSGSAPNCDDGVACTSDSCNEGTDSCDHTANNAACDDGLFCNGAETCHVTLGCQAGSDPCGGQPCNESTDTCGGEEVWIAFAAGTTVPGVGTAANEDIVSYNAASGTWSLIFDGSDVGLSSFVIDGVARLPSGEILYSVSAAGSIAGLVGGPSGASVDDSDIIRFTPTSLGSTTAGTHTFHFDGSDVGLTTDAEDIDAITVLSDGRIAVSTLDAFSVTGLSGQDEDLIVFNATSLGSVTSGSFGMYFDGSDVGLSSNANEDVDAAADTAAGSLLFSTLGAFSVSGASGADEDVVEFFPTSLGSATSGTYLMFLDLSTIGIATSANANAVEIVEP